MPRNSQQVRVLPLSATATHDAEDSVPRWCVRVIPGVAGSTYVTGFADRPKPFISVVVESPQEQVAAERFVEELLVKRMGAAETSRLPATTLRFPRR